MSSNWRSLDFYQEQNDGFAGLDYAYSQGQYSQSLYRDNGYIDQCGGGYDANYGQWNYGYQPWSYQYQISEPSYYEGRTEPSQEFQSLFQEYMANASRIEEKLQLCCEEVKQLKQFQQERSQALSLEAQEYWLDESDDALVTKMQEITENVFTSEGALSSKDQFPLHHVQDTRANEINVSQSPDVIESLIAKNEIEVESLEAVVGLGNPPEHGIQDFELNLPSALVVSTDETPMKIGIIKDYIWDAFQQAKVDTQTFDVFKDTNSNEILKGDRGIKNSMYIEIVKLDGIKVAREDALEEGRRKRCVKISN